MTDASREVAINIWPVLVEVAHQRTSIEYGELARRIGLGTARLGRQLEVIWQWCEDERLPPLTMLVVDASTYLPNCEPWSD